MKPFWIRWQNFRGFADTGQIEIRPLTLLIGPNNSGKSSVLAPLLLLKQTLESRDPETPLVTRGHLVNAGSYKDLVRSQNAARSVSFTIAFKSKPHRSDLLPIGRYPPGKCRMTFAHGSDDGSVVLKRFQVFDVYGRPYLERRRRSTGTYSLEGFKGLQALQTARDTSINTPADKAARREIAESHPDHFLFTGHSTFRKALSAVSQKTQPRTMEFSKYASLYLAVVEDTNHSVTDILENIYYLGPLREHPRRTYELSGATPADVGTRGEYAPELIYRNPKGSVVPRVTDWLRRFGFAAEVGHLSHTEGSFSVCITRGQEQPSLNLADTGFGISQILPLLVQGAYGPEQSLIIAEQPEIHLNPKLQSVLADLFCEIAAQGGMLLVETHSEHLLLRLRTLVAENKIPADDVALYYVEKHGENSAIRRVPIETNGHIEPSAWPAGFFEDSLQEAFALISAQAKRVAGDD